MKHLLTLCLALLSLNCSPAPTDSSKKLNVVLISLDSIRRDHIGAYGHSPQYTKKIPVSPNIDALALEGFVFDNAFTTTSWTLPSHMSLMTGLSDSGHGVHTDRFKKDPLHKTLASEFSSMGYKTAGFYSGPYLDPKYGFGFGFEQYSSAMLTQEQFQKYIEDENSRLKAAGRNSMTAQMVKQLRDRISHWDITSPKVNKLAKNFLSQTGKEPFFLFLHYFDAHYDHIPHSVSPQLAYDFDPEYSGDFDGTNWYFDSRVMETSPPFKRKITERDLNHVMAFYDAEIHWVDQHVGEIIQLLKNKGIWEDTIIMIVSDHGDEFFDHNSIGHRSTLFSEQVHIPMILRTPNRSGNGKRISNISRIYDVAPTLIDLATHGDQEMSQIEGESLLADLEGAEKKRIAFQSLFTGGHRSSRNLTISQGFRNENYSVIQNFKYDQKNSTKEILAVKPLLQRVTNTPFLVFNRIKDPSQTTPLSPKSKDYQNAIKAFEAAIEQQAKVLNGIPRSSRQKCLLTAKDDNENAMLEQLGYTEGEIEEELDFDILSLRLKIFNTSLE